MVFSVLRPNRLLKGANYIPASTQSVAYSAGRNTKKILPLSSVARFAVDGNNPISPSVISLDGLGGPKAILWSIIPVIISSFNRVISGWFFTYITEKLRIGGKPLFTHFNASAAVIFISSAAGVVTPCLYSCPAPIFSAFIKSMRSISLYERLRRGTTAAFRAASSKIVAPYNLFRAAFAKAVPCNSTVLISTALRDNCKSSKFLPCKIDFFHSFKSVNSLGAL